METWIYFISVGLIIPVIMIIAGIISVKIPPKRNYFAGYRTRMAMKNQDTWAFAQNYFGKLWYIVGLFLLIPSVIVIVLLLFNIISNGASWGLAFMGIQFIIMFITIIFTEKALRANFDKDGNRRK